MKRIFVLLMCVLLLTAIFSLFVMAEDDGAAIDTPTEAVQGDPRPSWQIYLEDKLYPTVASALSGAGVAYVLFLPIIKRILRTCGVLDNTAGGLCSVSKGAEASGAEIATLRTELTRMGEKICTMEQSNRELLRLGIQVMSLAFSHESELVQNGTARAIQKAVESYGKEK